MRTNMGFDMIESDVNFLCSHAASPFTPEECKRVNGSVKCTPLSDKTFKSSEEFLRTLYGNTDLLMAIREKLRIRGFGFRFETDYQSKLNDLEAQAAAKGEHEMPTEEPDGLAGDQGQV